MMGGKAQKPRGVLACDLHIGTEARKDFQGLSKQGVLGKASLGLGPDLPGPMAFAVAILPGQVFAIYLSDSQESLVG